MESISIGEIQLSKVPILAFFHLAGLKEREDFFITTTSSGRKNYHVKVTPQTFNLLLKPLLV
jgi:hypothetical protein